MADWDRAAWSATIEANMLAPIFLIHTLLPGTRRPGFGLNVLLAFSVGGK